MKYGVIMLITAALIVGSGCLRARVPVDNGRPAMEQVADLLGVIDAVHEDGSVELILADGGKENILLSVGSVTQDRVGLLLRVSGVRDPSTRAIAASTFETLDSPNIFVTSPTVGATVTSPLLVFGFGRIFEQTLNWRVKDAAGVVRAEGIGMTTAPDVGIYGPYRVEIFLPALSETSFTLDVFDYSARDGSVEDLVSIPLTLLSTKTSTFDVYMPNTRKGSSEDCSRVFPLQRTIAQTAAIGRASLLALLNGPTADERADGYFTSVPDYVSLNSLVIDGGVARADFNEFLDRRVGGSCRVTSIRSMIEQTLLQFPTVSEVTISIDGRTEDILQP